MKEVQAFAKNVWIVEGPSVRDMGFLFTTRMTIVKLSNGSAWDDIIAGAMVKEDGAAHFVRNDSDGGREGRAGLGDFAGGFFEELVDWGLVGLGGVWILWWPCGGGGEEVLGRCGGSGEW